CLPVCLSVCLSVRLSLSHPRLLREAEVWRAGTKQAGASWTKTSFAAGAKVERDFTVTLPPADKPAPLSGGNLRQQAGHKAVRTYCQETPVGAGGTELIGVYPFQAMMAGEETSSIHAVDDDDSSGPEP